MIELIFAGAIYAASLDKCFDGDSCTLHFDNVPPFLREQQIRFADFDTPEIKGKCPLEIKLAKKARKITTQYMQNNGKIILNKGRDKYGRLLVTAPELAKQLINAGLARPYSGGARKGWCD